MLEKALERLERQNYHNPSQVPEIFIEIKEGINVVRAWIEEHRVFSGFPIFESMLPMFVNNIADQVAILIETTGPVKGKKAVKKSLRARQQEKLYNAIDKMIGHLMQFPDEMQFHDETIFNEPLSEKIEKALVESFKKDCLKKYERRWKDLLSQRGEKTYIFPWSDPDEYHVLVGDRKRFKLEVVKKLGEHIHATGHKPGCKCQKNYKMKGFRPAPRKTNMPGGKKEEFRIRMVECSDCGQRFSLLPSFLPREKHFSINVIGHVIRKIALFAESINGVLEDMKELFGKEIKSKQTIFNWLKWMGTNHPATILTRAGITGSGYFQEDEGFEKEPGLRTYSVVMVDPRTMIVWHIDYVDHVDEKTLTSSFEEFVEKIDFKVLGITKDRWKPATDALKKVFHGVWIGFCHLHCMKKMSKALSGYQEETQCSNQEINKLYKKFKNALTTATSAASMRAKLKYLDDKAFEHPLLKARLDEIKENAAHYTSYKNRKGMTTTTSIADNFLKIIKRKLRQISSFRDKDCAKLFFKATANIRNFVPFLSGAKNAHQSPFIMAGGETFDLPWMQILNMHNAFLFTPNAF